MFYSVECEAPGGGYGSSSILVYNKTGQYIERVDYLDLILDVWLGGELIQHVQCYGVTVELWSFLQANGIVGVSSREMTVTPSEHLNDLYPSRVIPRFKELVLPRNLRGVKDGAWRIEKDSIPNADLFAGAGLPLFLSEHGRELLLRYGVTGLEIDEAVVT